MFGPRRRIAGGRRPVREFEEDAAEQQVTFAADQSVPIGLALVVHVAWRTERFGCAGGEGVLALTYS